MNSSIRDSLFYRLTTPLQLLFSLFSYSIGIGLAHHLGVYVDWFNALLGLILCFLLIAMRNLLNAYFEHPVSTISSLSRSDPLFDLLLAVKRVGLLQIGLLVLTAGAMLTVLVAFRGSLDASTLVYLGLAFLLSFFSAVPPLRLDVNGYGAVVDAIQIPYLFPALGLSLQGKPSHILLVMLTIPLVFFYLGMQSVQGLRSFGFDEMHNKKSLTTMLGWQKSVQLHNLSILVGFLLVGVFLLIGLPWRLAWPILLALPLGGFEIYLVILLAEGGKPRWQMLTFSSTTLFLLVSYLISLTLWIN